MKTLTYIVLTIGLLSSGCSSQKKLVLDPPFVVENATCQKWTGGRAESGSGMNMELPFTSDAEVSFTSVYFRGKLFKCKVEQKEGKKVLKATYLSVRDTKPDMVMHSDSTKEVGNQPPELSKKMVSGFKLESDEAIIVYVKAGDSTENFTKVSDIKEKKPLIYQ
ncbi:MAG: hypothetical protein AAGB24_02710 [Bacteroidota bacterium]